MPDAEVDFVVDVAVDLGRVLGPQRRGPHDPTMRISADGVWRTARTPEGPVTQHLSAQGRRVVSRAWGPGAQWASDHAPALVGADDDPTGFDPESGLIQRQWQVWRDRWRVPKGRNVWECAVAAVLEQKVTGIEAYSAWRGLVRGYGERAPGPQADLWVCPGPRELRSVPTWVWRRHGVDRSRSDTIMRLTRVPHVLERLPAESPHEARRLLTAIPGVGQWTYAEVAQRALGDADAVSVGDFHLAADVVWALTGEFGGTDEQMLELLAPYAGHRYRAVRMLELSGRRRPRRGPRMAIPPHRRG